jgi:hypothetical protein
MTRRSLALVVTVVIASTGCGSLDEDQPLGDQLDADDRTEFVDGVMKGAAGLLARSEAECWSDALFESGATPAQLEEWSRNPLEATGLGVENALSECVDPELEIDVPLEGDVQDDFVTGLTSSGMTDEQAQCVLDGLDGAGYDARDLMLAGLSTGPAGDEIGRALAEIGAGCL